MSDIGGSSASGKFKAFDSKFMDRPLQKSPEQKLRDVSDMYEKHFLREMMKAMRSTVHESGFVQSNQAEKIFREQLDDHYVDKWGERGGIGLSDMIYKQLADKFGSKMGIKTDSQSFVKPQGPLPFDKKNENSKIEFRAQPFQHPGKKESVSYRIDVVRKESNGGKSNLNTNALNVKNEHENAAALNDEAVKVPWDGVLLGKKSLADNQIMFEVEHDNGLKSQLVFKGNLSKVQTGTEVGAKLQAGDTLGFLGADAKSLYWTVEKGSGSGPESRPETVSE